MLSSEPSHQPAPAGDRSPAEARLAANLAFASRMLSLDGHDDLNQGQVSARLPRAERVLIKQALRGFNEAGPEDMIWELADPAAPASRDAPPELPLHRAIYAARPDVNAIVHSHAPYTLVFGATEMELQPLSHDGAYFEGIPRFTQTSHTVLHLETGQAIAQCLGDRSAVFLRNHGGVVVGRSIREAAVAAQILERACRLQLMAVQAGVKYHVSRADDIARKRSFIYSETSVKSYWDYLVRLVKARWPEAAPW